VFEVALSLECDIDGATIDADFAIGNFKIERPRGGVLAVGLTIGRNGVVTQCALNRQPSPSTSSRLDRDAVNGRRIYSDSVRARPAMVSPPLLFVIA